MTTQTNGDDCRESGARKTSRRAFEGWIRRKGLDIGNSLLMVDNRYYKKSIQDRWEGWEESRAAIEIEMPENADAEDKEEMLEMCRQSVHYAGLKIKGES